MINAGGWLLLSVIFGGLLLLVQRAEQNRRIATLVILIFVASLASSYGIYRMTQCIVYPPIVCKLPNFTIRASAIAYSTANLAAFTAIAFNLFFWAFIGRYNPPGTSDSIKVLGMND